MVTIKHGRQSGSCCSLYVEVPRWSHRKNHVEEFWSYKNLLPKRTKLAQHPPDLPITPPSPFQLSSSHLIYVQVNNMLEMDVNEPSVPIQAIHNARLSFTGQASQRADSTAPEGGYGWKVVFACCCVSFWAVGSLYSWGVMQAALFKQGLSSPSTLSWIGSLTFAWIALLALVNARVIRLLGARTTALLGIFTLSLGHILSGFGTHHVGVLFFTTGVLSGIGTRYGNRLIS